MTYTISPVISPDIELAILSTAMLFAALTAVWLVASVVGWTVTLRRATYRSRRWHRVSAPGAHRCARALLSVFAVFVTACSASPTPPTLTRLDAITTDATNSAPTVTPPTTEPPATEPQAPGLRAPTSPSNRLTTTEPSRLEPSTTVLPSTEASSLPDESTITTYIVQPGDNLWTIAHRLVEPARSGGPTTGEVAIAWRALIDLNRHRIASGDVDVIHPGEELQLNRVPLPNGNIPS